MFLEYLHKLISIAIIEFYKRDEEVYTFISFILLMRIMQVCFDIKDFNYMIVVILYFIGLMLYRFVKSVYKVRLNKLVFLTLILTSLYTLYRISNTLVKYIEQWFIEGFININLLINSSEPTYFLQYLPFFVILIPVTAALIRLFFAKSLDYLVPAAILLYMLLFWYLGYDNYIKDYLLIYLFMIAGMLAANMYKSNINFYGHRGFNIQIKRKSIILLALIMCSFVVLLTALFINGMGTKSIWQIAEHIKMMKRQKNISSIYDISSSGYNYNDEKLGGPVLLNTETVFKVKSDAAYYLKGTVKDYYDGYKWVRTSNSSQSSVKSFTIDKQYISTGDFTKNYLKDEIVIYPGKALTSILFVPDLTYDLKLSSGGYALGEDGVYNMTDGDLARDPYTVSFYKLEPRTDGFISGYLPNIPYIAGRNRQYTDDYYKNTVYESYKKYLQLPDNISDEIYRLVGSITDESRTSDNVENIRLYLSNNYKYSLDVSEVPEGTEFLNHFLFNEKKGYCTYFATASTIFCRMAGIPARLVEGYKMEDNKDSLGLYTVTEGMAHAWTEVLVYPEQNIWCILDCTPIGYEDEIKMNIASSDRVKNMSTSGFLKKELQSKNSKNYKDMQKTLYNLVLSPVFYEMSVLIIAVLYCMFIFIKHKKYMDYVLDNASLIPIYHYARNRLICTGIKKPEGNDDAKWLENMEDEDLKKNMKHLVDTMYKEFYGNKKIDDFDIKSCYIYIEQYIKKHQNKLIYYLKKYFYI